MKTRRQRLGQHFLHDQYTIEKILQFVETEISCFEKVKTLLEIGPGKLALTRGLNHIAEKKTLPFFAIEQDQSFQNLILNQCPHIKLTLMDAAKPTLVDFFKNLSREKQTPVFVVSNLPYSASSQILANLCYASRFIAGCVVMVQKELGHRMIASPGSSARGAFSLLIQTYFKVRSLLSVKPEVFTPPPKVESTVLLLQPYEQPLTNKLKNPLDFENFCKRLFSQRRKMIRNLLPKEKQDIFGSLGLSGSERPQELNLETIFQLYYTTS